jgi:hypothetical protein
LRRIKIPLHKKLKRSLFDNHFSTAMPVGAARHAYCETEFTRTTGADRLALVLWCLYLVLKVTAVFLHLLLVTENRIRKETSCRSRTRST